MTEEQIAIMEKRSRDLAKAEKALRKLVTDMFPVGFKVPFLLNDGSVGHAEVVSYARDAVMIHAVSSRGNHRLYPSDIIAAAKRGA